MAGFRPYIVGIGGTTRPGSSSEKALRYALALAEARAPMSSCSMAQVSTCRCTRRNRRCAPRARNG